MEADDSYIYIYNKSCSIGENRMDERTNRYTEGSNWIVFVFWKIDGRRGPRQYEIWASKNL